MRRTPSTSQNSVEECSCDLTRLTSPTGTTKNRPIAKTNETISAPIQVAPDSPSPSSTLFWLIEGVLRTAIFLGYLLLLSRLRDLRRVFEYHGAEHKTIACHEAGQELTPENAAAFSRLHPRCGTSFLLIVMIVAIFVFAPIGLPAWYWLLATRVLGVPLIAGISFEIIKFAARHRDRAAVRVLMAPGLALQRLTTREPDHAELAVAIAALRSVLEVEAGDQGSAADLVGLEVVA